MIEVDVTTQTELDAALARGELPRCVGDGDFRVEEGLVRAYGSSTVWAYGSSTVWAYGSSTVRADGSSTVRAYGSSTVWAYGSSTVRADGSSTVRAYGSASIRAGKFVPVQDHGPDTKIAGGVLISVRRAKTATEWLEFHGVDVDEAGVAILYKAVEADWRASWKNPAVSYEPGSVPVAPDWDGGRLECGGGLHFSPLPWMAAAFLGDLPAHFVACPVAVTDIVVHPDGAYPDKVKARGCAGPVAECDIDGNLLEQAATDGATS